MGGSERGKAKREKDDAVERAERKQRAGKKSAEVDLDESETAGEGASDKEGLRKVQQWVAEVLKYREYHPIVEHRSPQQVAIDRELAKRYSRYQMHEHRLVQRICKAKLRAKWAAINALPQALKEQTLKVDDSTWPLEFPIPEEDLAPKQGPFPPPYIPTHLRKTTNTATTPEQKEDTKTK